jgi:hypothetical protein
LAPNFQVDIDAVARIAAVPWILDVICRATGMRFSAVARVTEDRWVCLASKDEIQFGLAPGGELEVSSTICDEIRESRRPVVIDHVKHDDTYRAHHTPAKYGFQSYISVPIFLSDGSFYGTLCAIDPQPAELSKSTAVDIFAPFARGTRRGDRSGLGLGLYIASEIARAHGGTLRAQSTADSTRFTFTMPL